MNHLEWEREVPDEIKGDTLWKMRVYRQALFLGDLAWRDASKIGKQRQLWSVSDQLYRAIGSISANIAEGYSRGGGRDRARFYEYALGSARESRDWYFKARHALGDEVVKHRFQILAEIIRLLLVIIPKQRSNTFRESEGEYHIE